MARWSARDIGDLRGRTAVVTGSNKGIGFQAALVLARRGARVVVATRDAARGRAAVESIRRLSSSSLVEREELDLSRLRSVRAFAERFLDRHDRLDILLNNAAIGYVPRGLTEDGFESTFGTNHLGHFALTGLLLPRLLATPKARVVTVASRAHEWPVAELDLDDPRFDLGYDRTAAYARSKLANVLFAIELHRRVARAGHDLCSVAASPRLTATTLGPPERLRRMLLRIRLGRGTLPVEIGTEPVLYAATATGVRGADYVQPEYRGGPPATIRPAPRACDPDTGERLWALSEELTGVVFPLEVHLAGALATV